MGRAAYFRNLGGLLLIILLGGTWPAVALAINLKDTDWPIHGGNRQMNKISPYTGSEPKTLKFRYSTDSVYHHLRTNTGYETQIVIDGEKIYLPIFESSPEVPTYKSGYLSLTTDGEPITINLRDHSNNNSNWRNVSSFSLTDDGNIYQSAVNWGRVLAWNPAYGALKYINTCTYGAPSQASSVNFSPQGIMVMAEGNTGSIVGCDPETGDQIWRYPDSHSRSSFGTVVFDTAGNVYHQDLSYGLSSRVANTGALNWRAVQYAQHNVLGLSQDETVLVGTCEGFGLRGLDTATGKTLWTVPVGSIQPSFGIGEGVVYHSRSGPVDQLLGQVIATNIYSGEPIWEKAVGVDYEASHIALDQSGALFLSANVATNNGRQMVRALETADGSDRWIYDTGLTASYVSAPSIANNGDLFFHDDYRVYGLTPWKITPSVKRLGPDLIQIEASSSMLRQDPNSNFANRMQLFLSDTWKVPMDYVQSDNGQSVWRAVIQGNLANLPSTAQIEAVAFGTVTQIATHFNVLSVNFQNTGLTEAVDLSTVINAPVSDNGFGLDQVRSWPIIGPVVDWVQWAWTGSKAWLTDLWS